MKKEVLDELEREFGGIKEVIKATELDYRDVEFVGIKEIDLEILGIAPFKCMQPSIHQERRIFGITRTEMFELEKDFDIPEAMFFNEDLPVKKDGDTIYSKINKAEHFVRIDIDYSDEQIREFDCPKLTVYKKGIYINNAIEKYKKKIREEIYSKGKENNNKFEEKEFNEWSW